METKAKKQKVEFIAVAQFGWKHASSPAMAIQKVRDFTFMQDRPERGSDEWEESQDAIQLWMVKSDEWIGLNHYCPIDQHGQPCGLLLHGYKNKEDQLETYERMSEAVYND
tara:strand:+ start:45 stop:377 length:333 start_codon:yes stop_codon:yes gene_type:complete